MGEEGAGSHLWKPGQSGCPAGRPKGAVSGRAKALAFVDACILKAENAKTLEKALDEALQKKPLWFFVNIIMPLLPKETRGLLESGDRVIEWRGLTGVCAVGAAAPAARGGAIDVPPGASGDAGFVAGAAVCGLAPELPLVAGRLVGEGGGNPPTESLPFPACEEKPPF